MEFFVGMVLVRTQWGGGGAHCMRTCAYNRGGGQVFVILVRRYYLNDLYI